MNCYYVWSLWFYLVLYLICINKLLHGQTVSLSIDQFMNSLSLEQKLGQMTQLDITVLMRQDDPLVLNQTALDVFSSYSVGSYLNTPFAGGPIGGSTGWNAEQWRKIISKIQDSSLQATGIPVVYGIDSIHGANYVQGAVLFPQPLNIGNTFNRDLAFEIGRITGRDTLAAGISWTFAPVLDIAIKSRWSRNYETFGEDPYSISELGYHFIRGVQTNEKIAACFKHFIAYSATSSGYDRDNVQLDTFQLLNYYLLPYISAIDAGSLTGMESYAPFNGVPTIMNPLLLSTLLRRDLKFDGVLVTDYSEIYNLQAWHRSAATREESVALALNGSSFDLNMVAKDLDFIRISRDLVLRGVVPMERINKSVKRILQLKQQLGLFGNPVPGRKQVSRVGNRRDQGIALETARESMVLLQNRNNVLPLPMPSTNSKVFITGIGLDSIGLLCSGWTLHWQGTSGNTGFYHGETIRGAFEKLSLQSCDDSDSGLLCSGDNADYTDYATMDNVYRNASTASYTIIVLSEPTYAEKPGDIDDLTLNSTQAQLVRNIADNSNTRIILVLVQGRPRLLGNLPKIVDGIIFAGFPCEFGGQAITEVILGLYNPNGKLPLTYPKASGDEDLPYYRYRTALNASMLPIVPQWGFGTGLSYTTFTYSAISLNDTVLNPYDVLQVKLTVTNTGTRSGKETIFLYLSQLYRQIHIPEVKVLKRFDKIYLAAADATTLTYTLSFNDWSVITPTAHSNLQRQAQSGDYYIVIGSDTMCDIYSNVVTNPKCQKFTLVV